MESRIEISDAKWRVGTKIKKTYKVRDIARNGEILKVSENFESVAAVKKHIAACLELYQSPDFVQRARVADHTKSQVFVAKGIAGKSGLKK